MDFYQELVVEQPSKLGRIYPKRDDGYSNTLIKSKTDCSNVPGMYNQLQKKTKVIEEGIKDVIKWIVEYKEFLKDESFKFELKA